MTKVAPPSAGLVASDDEDIGEEGAREDVTPRSDDQNTKEKPTENTDHCKVVAWIRESNSLVSFYP